METPLIAIVGSADPERQDELGLVHPELAHSAAEELGSELARHGCRIVVYSSDPQFIEASVVRGYVESGQASRDSILVRYPADGAEPSFPETAKHRECFQFAPDTSDFWEVSFYRSVCEANGVILLGGGRSSLIAGVVAVSQQLSVLALATFGGAARDVWRDLPARGHLTMREELQLMGQAWSPGMATKCIEALLAQCQRLEAERQQRRLAEAEEKQRRADEAQQYAQEQVRQQREATRAAWVAAGIILTAVAVAALLWRDSTHYSLLVGVLFLMPAATGVAGGNAKRVRDFYHGGPLPETKYSAALSPLGLVAGAITGLLYAVGQITAFPDLPGASEALVSRARSVQAAHLIPFVLVVGVIGGFASERFFAKLGTMEPQNVGRG